MRMRQRTPAVVGAEGRPAWLPPSVPGTVALVTGASSGIGAEIARSLARRGHDLLLVARRGDRLEALARELSSLGVSAQAYVCDLTDPVARERLADEVARRGWSVSVLCNSPGYGIP